MPAEASADTSAVRAATDEGELAKNVLLFDVKGKTVPVDITDSREWDTAMAQAVRWMGDHLNVSPAKAQEIVTSRHLSVVKGLAEKLMNQIS